MSAQQIKRFVAEIYNTDTQVKRVLKEIDSLNTLDKASFKVQLTQFGLGFKIMVTIEPYLIDQHPSLASIKQYGPIHFNILLDNKFPFTHPKVVCMTPISAPSFADGRNLTPEIIQDQWAPSILMSKIILQIPQFLAVIGSKQKDKLFLIHLGGFQVGDEYDLEQFLNLNNVHIFSCQEHLPKGKPVNKFLVVTGSQFLSFAIINAKDNIVQLEKQYYLYEVQKIQVLQEKENLAVLQLEFLVQGDEGNEESELTVQLKERGVFIKAIQENIQRLDLRQVLPKKIEISEDDVTIKAYQSTDIELIETCIASLAPQIDQELKLSDINQLTELYQKAIEFYSAIADDRFMIYMKSLKELLQREDVQRVLQDKQESIKAEKENQLRASKVAEVQQQQLRVSKEEQKEQRVTATVEIQHEEAKSDTQNKMNKKSEEDSIFNDYHHDEQKEPQEYTQSQIDDNNDKKQVSTQVSSSNSADAQELQKKEEILEQEISAKEETHAEQESDNQKQDEVGQDYKQSEEDKINKESEKNEEDQGQKEEKQEKVEGINRDHKEQEEAETNVENKDEQNEQVQGEQGVNKDAEKEIEQGSQEGQEQVITNEDENNQKEEENEENNQKDGETGENQDSNSKKAASNKKGSQKKPPGRANRGAGKKA